MALYVVCYPLFAGAEGRRIEELRRQHDPQAGLIAAHVTLIFAAAGMTPEAAAGAMKQVSARTPRFVVTFGEVVARPGHANAGFYAYLLPERGGETLHSLHEQLYRGLLGRPPELPFEPHVTLARAEEAAPIDALVAELRGQRLASEAAIQTLHLVMPEQGGVTELARAELAA